MVKCKTEECEKLKQEVTLLKVDLERTKNQQSNIEPGMPNTITNTKEAREAKKEAKSDGEESSLVKETITEEEKGKSLIKQQVRIKNTSFYGSCYKCNKIGHRAVECKNSLNQSLNSFPSRCYTCNRYGHKANKCRNLVVNQNRYNYFRGRCYACNIIGHKAN